MSRLLGALVLIAGASSAGAAPLLVGLVPAATDDARQAVALGPQGQVYERGERRLAVTVAAAIDTIERGAGAGIVVGAGGAVYRLAANGWTAVRLAQKGRAVGGVGARGVAALGRDVFDLDRAGDPATSGEPARLATAPGAVLALAGGGTSVVVRTDRGVFRIDRGSAAKEIRGVPGDAAFVGERWAIGRAGVFDLRGKHLVKWPSGVDVEVAVQAPDGTLVGVSKAGEIVTVDQKIVRSPGPPEGGKGAVGIVADRAGRIAIAFGDGRIALRDRGTWTSSTVRDALPSDHPGSPPAVSGTP